MGDNPCDRCNTARELAHHAGPNRLETGGAAAEHKYIGREGHLKVSGESLDLGAMAAQNAQSEIVEPDAAPPLRLWPFLGPSATY